MTDRVPAPPSGLAAPVQWSPQNVARAGDWARPGAARAMLRGLINRCPCCGQAPLFKTWLRQVAACEYCHAPLGAVRADDAPPYFVILVVGHIIIAAQFALDSVMGLSLLAEAALFLPLTLALSLGLLRPVKGATVGLMLQLGLVPADDA
jgi:uncharacterized protein (DUF983 family)